MSLADLPTEILVQVFASLDSLRDAVNLSKTCSRFDRLLNDTWNMASILDAIADNIVLPETPDAAWLETHFGRNCLWKPSRSEIPPRISHAETIEFLTTIGFPDCSIGLHGIDLQHFRKNIEQVKHETWPYMHGLRLQALGDWDLETYYSLGFLDNQKVIVGGTSGRIVCCTLYVRGIGYWSVDATSIISFLVLLGTAVSSRNAIKEFIQRSSDPLKLAMGVWCLENVYFKMLQYDVFVEELSHLWWDLLFEGVDYTGYSNGPFSTSSFSEYGFDLEYGMDRYVTGIGANIVMPKNPDSTWLKTHFRVENLQTPDDSVLAAIEHVETRIFLSTVGFPDCSTRTGGLSSQRMSTVGIDGSTLNDPDIRDEDPPTLAGNYFLFDSASEFGMLFGTVKGDVIFCVFQGPGGTPCTDKHLSLGSAATSVSSFLVLLGTFLKFRRQVYEVMDLWTLSEVLPRLPIYETFLRRVYERMREYGNLPERYDSFWHDICGNFSLCSPSFKKLVMRVFGID
ncbi:hypothetical protein CDV55_100920 [Aspergillus turcosus]|nr:hypothetical protein CDV55_100920 [Aspergillus turcosus]